MNMFEYRLFWNEAGTNDGEPIVEKFDHLKDAVMKAADIEYLAQELRSSPTIKDEEDAFTTAEKIQPVLVRRVSDAYLDAKGIDPDEFYAEIDREVNKCIEDDACSESDADFSYAGPYFYDGWFHLDAGEMAKDDKLIEKEVSNPEPFAIEKKVLGRIH